MRIFLGAVRAASTIFGARLGAATRNFVNVCHSFIAFASVTVYHFDAPSAKRTDCLPVITQFVCFTVRACLFVCRSINQAINQSINRLVCWLVCLSISQSVCVGQTYRLPPHLRVHLPQITISIFLGSNPTEVRDFFSFPVWVHFLFRSNARKVLYEIFIRAL